MNNKAQFSIIAALFVAVVLISTVIVTYSSIRNSQVQEQPPIQSAIDETNLAIKQILGFTVGYYGSVLQVTGNSTYAKALAKNYLQSGLVNIANIHPEWGTSFSISSSELHTLWFSRVSCSTGNLTVAYNLTGIGISGITYKTSCELDVQVANNTDNQACLIVTKDEGEPVISLGKTNFMFYRYLSESSAWGLVNPETEPIAYANGTYQISVPIGVDNSSYMIRVEDPRGIVVVASSFSRLNYALSWNSTIYDPTLPPAILNSTLVVELMQNGTAQWLGENLRFTTQQTSGKPIPPIPVKAIHVNQTINGADREVPFQVEDWASGYTTPVGLTANETVFNGRTMLVFLVNSAVSKVTLWWNGSDTATQTSLAFENKWFAKDDIQNGILTNGDLALVLRGSTQYLYANSFDSTYLSWTEVGALPYLDDDSSNYIMHNGDYGEEGWFGFGDLTDAQAVAFAAISSVKIEFECKRDGTDDYFDFRINDGTTTYGSYSISPPNNNYGWRSSVEFAGSINNSIKMNNLRMSVRYRMAGGGASTVYIRRCRITLDFSGWLTSVHGSVSTKADFLRINNDYPGYGSNLAYVIHHGVVRDIIQQEAEWGNGINGCPNVYSHIVIMLPANATYYTYQIRLMFVSSQQPRNITDLCAIRITTTISQPQTENGTQSGYPVVSSASGLFYNLSNSGGIHHWSQFISGTKGAGLMFTDTHNKTLYVFDPIATSQTGAIKVDSSSQLIELLPVAIKSASFNYSLQTIWSGAVVTFDGATPIYKTESGKGTGLWILVEYPPKMTVSTES